MAKVMGYKNIKLKKKKNFSSGVKNRNMKLEMSKINLFFNIAL